MKFATKDDIPIVLFALFLTVGAFGWVWNIVKIMQFQGDSVTHLLLARCVGFFIPHIGAVIGFL